MSNLRISKNFLRPVFSSMPLCVWSF